MPPTWVASASTPIRTSMVRRPLIASSSSVTSDTRTPSIQVPSWVTRHSLSSPNWLLRSSHQLGVSMPRWPPKSAGDVQVATRTSLIHTVMSDGQSSWCMGASLQSSARRRSTSGTVRGGNRFGNR
ncbi:MAG: hypothetical protein U5K81_00835 [Trueperaceae bacterium]|nr:hypothetical protein [Trueperaceae bacterium]